MVLRSEYDDYTCTNYEWWCNQVVWKKVVFYTEEAESWNEITVAFEKAGLIDSKHLDDSRQEDGSYKNYSWLLNRIEK